jgi:hypothetical protein
LEQRARIPDKNQVENPTCIEFRNMHHINLPCYERLEVWFEDSIAPIKLNEYHNPSPNYENKESYFGQENFY